MHYEIYCTRSGTLTSIYRFIDIKYARYMITAHYGAPIAILEHKYEDLVDVFAIGHYLGENSKMKLDCCITNKCEVFILAGFFDKFCTITLIFLN